MTSNLSLDDLNRAVRDGAAIRRTARLQPAGGVGDKVFPPTYEGGTYALESRVVDGGRVPCVILDSVQSQANRMEACLLEAQRSGRLAIPVVTVDFGKAGLPEVGLITSLDAPHRLADAILRDSTLGGRPFRESEVGRVLDDARVVNATGLFGVCPTALIFGLWDSAGPRGGLGTKFARSLVGEIVGVDIEAGVRPSSRIDPLGIERNAAGSDRPIYQKGAAWTLVEAEADRDEKGKPKRVGKEGKPSEINHGNVTPSLKTEKALPDGEIPLRTGSKGSCASGQADSALPVGRHPCVP
jgi:CRISPR-associated protein Csb1